MPSYDHWLSQDGLAFARHLAANPQDRAAHGAFADYLEEHGDPLHAVVRRSPAYHAWYNDNKRWNEAGQHPLGDGESYNGYIVRSHSLDNPSRDNRAISVHHKVIGSKKQEGGRYSVLGINHWFPGSAGTANRARFVAPVTKEELKAIVMFHRVQEQGGMTGGTRGRMSAYKARTSPGVGEHSGIRDGTLDLGRREDLDAKVAQAKAYRQAILGKLAANPHDREVRDKLATFLEKLPGVTGDHEHDTHLAKLLRLHTLEVEMGHGTDAGAKKGEDLHKFRSFYQGSRGWLTDQEADGIRRLVDHTTAGGPVYGGAFAGQKTRAEMAHFLDKLSHIVPPYHPAYTDVKEQAVRERDPKNTSATRTPAFISSSILPHYGHQYGSYVGGRAMAEMHPTPEDALLYSIRHANRTGQSGYSINIKLPHDQKRRVREEARMGTPAQAAREEHPRIAAEAREYHATHRDRFGLDLSPDTPGPQWNPELSKRTAAAFEKAKHLPQHPKVKEAYDALKQEILAQHTFLTSKGVRFTPWTKEGQPYANSGEMMHDARENRHLHYFPTVGGFGKGEEGAATHPLNEDVPGRPGIKYNDLFRAVHDYFGHALAGHQFGPKGELQAWAEHAKMFSPKARLALTAETHGQNSWVNFGPQSHLPVTQRPFAEQKATIMPKNVTPRLGDPTKLAAGEYDLTKENAEHLKKFLGGKMSAGELQAALRKKPITPKSAAPQPKVAKGSAPVWRLAKDGRSHLVGLPQKDGTTLVRRFNSFTEAQPHVREWFQDAPNEHRTTMLSQMRALRPAVTPANPTPPVALGPTPVAKRIPVARPIWFPGGPREPQRNWTRDYAPGMEPPVKLAGVYARAGVNPWEHSQTTHGFVRHLAANPDDVAAHGAFADHLEEQGDPLHAIVRRAPAFKSWVASSGQMSHTGWHSVPRPMASGAGGPQYGIYHTSGVTKNPVGGTGAFHMLQVQASVPNPEGEAHRIRLEAPVTKNELRDIIRVHGHAEYAGETGIAGRSETAAALRSPGVGEHPIAAKNTFAATAPIAAPPVKLAREDVAAVQTVHHPEFLDKLFSGDIEGAKKFLEAHGDPAAELIEPGAKFAPDANTIPSYGPGTLSAYGGRGNRTAAVKVRSDGTAELHARTVTLDGPKAVGFRKKAGASLIRQLAAFHRKRGDSEVVKLARSLDHPDAGAWWEAVHSRGAHPVMADWAEEQDDPLAQILRTGEVGHGLPTDAVKFHDGKQFDLWTSLRPQGDMVVHVAAKSPPRLKTLYAAGIKGGRAAYRLAEYEADSVGGHPHLYRWRPVAGGPRRGDMDLPSFGVTPEDRATGVFRKLPNIWPFNPAGQITDRRQVDHVTAAVTPEVLRAIKEEYEPNITPETDWAGPEVVVSRRQTPDAQAARVEVTRTSLASALRDMKSQRQQVRRQLAAHVAKEAGMTLTSLADAASVIPHPRAGLVQAIQHNDPDAVNYIASWYGMLAREPRLTVFHPGEGNDVLHVTNSPLGVSQILETAGRHGLPGVAVSPDGGLHVLDSGGRNTRGVLGFLGDVRGGRPAIHRGTAHMLGAASGDDRQSRQAYRETIKKFQS